MSIYRQFKKVFFVSSLALSLMLPLQSYAFTGLAGASAKTDSDAIGAMFTIIGGGAGLVIGAIIGVVGIFNPVVLPAAGYVAAGGGIMLSQPSTHVMKAPRLTPEMIKSWNISSQQIAHYNDELMQLDMISETLQAQVLNKNTVKNGILYLDPASISQGAQTWKVAQNELSTETVAVLNKISGKMYDFIRAQPSK